MSGWRAGAAAEPFPVPLGTPMAGYAARDGGSTGILDELTISAVLLEHGERQLAILSVDFAGIDAALVDEVAAAAGIDRASLAICASHTHSGPAGVTARLHPADENRLDPALRAAAVTVCARVIQTASGRLESADLVADTAKAGGISANRNDPAGPADRTVTAIAARRRDGSLVALLVHFACHPTILGAESRLISAEFPGALRRALTGRLDPGATALYVNGAAGDVSTRYTRHGQNAAEVERVGSVLAEASLRALATARPLSGPLGYRRCEVPLPQRTLDGTHTVSAHPIPDDLPAAERRRAFTRAQGAAMLARLAGAEPGAIAQTITLEAWSLGGLDLLAMPAELFASLGTQIVNDTYPPVIVLGYANGYTGYLADSAAYAAETYEALASPYPAGTGERIAKAARALLTES